MSNSKQIVQSNEMVKKQQTLETAGPGLELQGQQTNPATIQRAMSNPGLASPEDILALQQTIGNRGTSRVLGKGAGAPVVQAKLTVGPVNDEYEQEADHVADQVVRQSPAAPTQRQEEDGIQMKPLAATISTLQRASLEEEELGQGKREVQRQEAMEEEDEEFAQGKREVQRQAMEEEELAQGKREVQRQDEEDELLGQGKRQIQRTAKDGSFEAGSDTEASLNSLKGGGSPLPDNVKSEMESSFGADLSPVRIHTGGQADALNQDLQAKAFTSGPDIAFKAGQFKPDTTEGKELLAHELTHVVQQGAASPARRKSDSEHE